MAAAVGVDHAGAEQRLVEGDVVDEVHVDPADLLGQAAHHAVEGREPLPQARPHRDGDEAPPGAAGEQLPSLARAEAEPVGGLGGGRCGGG